jgi:hypothetical protein
MAKLKDNPLAKTTPNKGDQSTTTDTSRTITSGLALRENEWQELEDAGAAFGLSRHGMTAYAVRYFLKLYRDGKIELESKPRLPGL